APRCCPCGPPRPPPKAGRLTLLVQSPHGVAHGASKHHRARKGQTPRAQSGPIAPVWPGAARWPGNDATKGSDMAESENYRKGMEMRRKLMGDAAVQQMAQGTYSDPVMRKFLDVAIENVFGALWTRPGLDIKTRALICVVSDVCTGREPELALHLRMALRQGWTEEELTETLLHLSGYVGVPLIRESMLMASKVFREFRDE